MTNDSEKLTDAELMARLFRVSLSPREVLERAIAKSGKEEVAIFLSRQPALRARLLQDPQVCAFLQEQGILEELPPAPSSTPPAIEPRQIIGTGQWQEQGDTFIPGQLSPLMPSQEPPIETPPQAEPAPEAGPVAPIRRKWGCSPAFLAAAISAGYGLASDRAVPEGPASHATKIKKPALDTPRPPYPRADTGNEHSQHTH